MLLFPAIWTLLLAAASSGVSAEDAGDDLMQFFDEYTHECVRNCTLHPAPRVCRYSFRLEWFMTMSRACFDCPATLSDCYRPHCITGDGFKRALLSVNRQLSGPGIHVCEGDTVNVQVNNMMEMSEGTSIHWHGLHHRDNTQHMDGVSQITQCAINSHSTFVYSFKASPAGTHFWHSHSGMQRAEGIYGPLVVRQAADPHAALYDFDLPSHTLILSDWFHELTANKFANIHYSNGGNKQKGIVINGRGAFEPIVNGTHTPRYVLKVQRGKRYRIRVISNGVLNCPFDVSVENHSLLVIASDGAPFQPVEMDSIIVYAGERFDFVLTANQSVGNYLLKAVGLADCSTRFISASQSAIVSYEGENEKALQGRGNPPYESMLTFGRQLNPYNRLPSPGDYNVTALKSLEKDSDGVLVTEPDVKFYLAFDFEKVNNPLFHNPAYYPISVVPKSNGLLYTPQINNVAMSMPTAPLFQEVYEEALCNNTEFNPSYVTNFKSCVHALSIGLNQVVEIVLIDKGVTLNASHPFHLHGQQFRVIGMGKLGSSTSVNEVKALDSANGLQRNLNMPVLKDSVIVPDGGYTVIRFKASNPGPWLLHCHLEFHMESGMGLLLLVGDRADWAAKVPENFPRCGPWLGPGLDSRLEELRRWKLGLATGLSVAIALLVVAISVGIYICRNWEKKREGGKPERAIVGNSAYQPDDEIDQQGEISANLRDSKMANYFSI